MTCSESLLLRDASSLTPRRKAFLTSWLLWPVAFRPVWRCTGSAKVWEAFSAFPAIPGLRHRHKRVNTSSRFLFPWEGSGSIKEYASWLKLNLAGLRTVWSKAKTCTHPSPSYYSPSPHFHPNWALTPTLRYHAHSLAGPSGDGYSHIWQKIRMLF